MKAEAEPNLLERTPIAGATHPVTLLFRRVFPKLTPKQAELLAGIKFPCC